MEVSRLSLLVGLTLSTSTIVAYAGSMASVAMEQQTESDVHPAFPVAVVTVMPTRNNPSAQPIRRNTIRMVQQPSTTAAVLPVVSQPDIRREDQTILSDALRWYPSLCRDALINLVIEYDAAADRGLATSRTILLRGGMSRMETIAVLLHECGHIIDLGGLKGTPDAGQSPYPDGPMPTYHNDPSATFYAISWETETRRRPTAREADFVSGYAMQDPFEDVAETILYYALHNRAFRQRAAGNESLARKYAWVRQHVFGHEFQPLPGKAWDGERVWDITKLAHQLSL